MTRVTGKLVFSDASLCNINNGTGSTGAHIVWLVDNDGKCCPLSWLAGKIKRVVRSKIAAESLSLQDMDFDLIDLSTKLKQGTINDLSRAIKVTG